MSSWVQSAEDEVIRLKLIALNQTINGNSDNNPTATLSGFKVDNDMDQINKVLILTVGLPRSGKSTWARLTGHPIVNPDSIRLAIHGQRFYGPCEPFVWAVAYTMVDALFKAGHGTVIVDATNNTAKRRVEWFIRFGNVKLKFFHTLPEECAERARQAGDLEIIPVIERMAVESDWESSGAILLPQIE